MAYVQHKLLALVLALTTVSCASRMVNIAAVLQEGRHADGRKVHITGDVASVPEEGPPGYYSYELTDGTGRISIQTHLPPPAICHTIRLTGKVGSVFVSATNRAKPGAVYARWWAGLAITEIAREDLGVSATGQIFGCPAPASE